MPRQRERYLTAMIGSALAVVGSCTAFAQQANVGVPFGSASDSFFENTGVGFGFRGPGFFFQQSSFGQALPPFGGFDPGAGANFGFGVGNGPYQANFNFAFGQGSRSSLVSQSPSVTVGNGAFGAFSAGTWTPFVVGAIPVVGDAPAAPAVPFGPAGSPSILEERLSRIGAEPHKSSLSSGAGDPEPVIAVDPSLDPFQRQLATANARGGGAPTMSVAGIEQLRDAERAAKEQTARIEIDRLIAQADAAMDAGKPRVARIYLQQAARRAEGPQKQQLLDRVEKLRTF